MRNLLRLAVFSAALVWLPIAPAAKGNLDGFDDYMAKAIDETPAAYKRIDAVMAAQADLVEIVHTLRQVVCVRG
jgi:RNA-splicing ligase RtcB